MKLFKSTLTSLLLISLTACNDHQPAKPPTENLGVSDPQGSASSTSGQNYNASLVVQEREYGDSGVTIALDAKITNMSTVTDINWSQISGPVATIINADQLSASVILPFVETPTTMEFEITVSHGTQTLSAIQSVTILPLPAKVAVDNPVLSIEDQFIRATLLTPIEPNTEFALSIVGGTAIEGIDFAPLPATVTAVDGASLNIPIAILPNDRTQDVYAKLALQAPNQEIITFIFVAPAETAGGTQAPSSAISTSSNMASSSATSETSTSSNSGSASSQNSDLTKNYDTREAYRIAEWYSFNSLDLTLDNIVDAIDSGNLDQLKSDFKETYIYDELGRLDEYLFQSQSQRTQGTYSYNEVDNYLISSISEVDEIAQIGDTDTPQKILSSTEFSFNDDSVSITSFSDDINYRSEIFLELNQNELVTTKHYSPESQASHASTDIFEWERDTLLSWYRQDFEGNVYEAYTYSYLGDFATGADYEFTSDTGEITSETEIYHYYSHNNRIYFITETSSDGEPTLYDVKLYDYLTCHESEWRKIKFGWDLPNYPSCLDSSVLDLATVIDTL